ncbi:MAG: tetratricopeptide repeat protein [Candidatus Eisenbacteria bacterium]|nr:tetratricopeptide repeat protein [Candidatus Eisenbacteria bacterium]
MRRRGLAFAFFLLALLSKTVTATLPAAILLLIYWKRGAISRRDITPLIVFFALGIGFGLTTAWLEKHHVGAQGADWSLTLVERLCLAARIALFYAGKLLWPHPLAFIYPRWDATGVAPLALFFPLLLLGAIALLWLRRDRFGRGPLVAVLFFVGTLLPALGLIDVFPMRYSWVADHFQYHASIGLLALAGGGLALALSSLRPIPRAALLALPVLACAAGTALRTPAYRDLRTLWTDTLAKNPDAWMAHHNLGMVEFDAGRVREAIERYRAALAIREDLPNTHYNLGSALARAGHPDLALVHLERARPRSQAPGSRDQSRQCPPEARPPGGGDRPLSRRPRDRSRCGQRPPEPRLRPRRRRRLGRSHRAVPPPPRAQPKRPRQRLPGRLAPRHRPRSRPTESHRSRAMGRDGGPRLAVP